MQQNMQGLYNEIWGHPLPIVKNYEVRVPQANYGLRPGYKIDMKSSTIGTFVLPEFQSKKIVQKFQKIEVQTFLPCGVKQLLVRPQYEDLRLRLNRAEKLRWQGAGRNSVIPGVRAKLDYEISGQPGTGKTFFLSYLLVCRLHNRLPTVYRTDDQRCFLFNETSEGTEVSLQFLSHLPLAQKRRLWVLTDEKIENTHWNVTTSGWFVVLAASPKKMKASHDWEKARNVSLYFMSIWSWPEIFAAYCLEKSKYPTQHHINKLFTTFECLGPVPRTCFQEIVVGDDELYNESLESYLSKVDREIEKFIIEGGRETLDHELHEHSSHRIALMHPSKSGLSYKARLITRWIAFRVNEKALRHSQLESFLLYKNLSLQANMRTAAGWFFEGYVHEWFLQGGRFLAEEIPIGAGIPAILEFGTVQAEWGIPEYFTNPNSLLTKVKEIDRSGINPAVLQKYFLPWSRNYPSIDGLLFYDLETILFLQITIAERHEIKSPGVAELLKVLPKTIKNVYFLFVVPEDCKEHYAKPQLVPNSETICPRRIRTKLNVKQFRLIFAEKSMQEVARLPYRGGQDSEVEVFDYYDSD